MCTECKDTTITTEAYSTVANAYKVTTPAPHHTPSTNDSMDVCALLFLSFFLAFDFACLLVGLLQYTRNVRKTDSLAKIFYGM